MRQSTLYLCRHGDTEWSTVRRLAGRTDLPLTAQGEANARQLGTRLHDVIFDRALMSPLLRARRTAELAGFAKAHVDDRLREMDFGRYEGLTIADIRRQQPDWTYLRDGCPGGEDADDPRPSRRRAARRPRVRRRPRRAVRAQRDPARPDRALLGSAGERGSHVHDVARRAQHPRLRHSRRSARHRQLERQPPPERPSWIRLKPKSGDAPLARSPS